MVCKSNCILLKFVWTIRDFTWLWKWGSGRHTDHKSWSESEHWDSDRISLPPFSTFSCDMFDNIQPDSAMCSSPSHALWTSWSILDSPLPSSLLILLCVTPRTKNQIEIFQFLLLDFTTRSHQNSNNNHKPQPGTVTWINPVFDRPFSDLM